MSPFTSHRRHANVGTIIYWVIFFCELFSPKNTYATRIDAQKRNCLPQNLKLARRGESEDPPELLWPSGWSTNITYFIWIATLRTDAVGRAGVSWWRMAGYFDDDDDAASLFLCLSITRPKIPFCKHESLESLQAVSFASIQPNQLTQPSP